MTPEGGDKMVELTEEERNELIERVSSRIHFKEDNKFNSAVVKLAATVSILMIQEYEKMKAGEQ